MEKFSIKEMIARLEKKIDKKLEEHEMRVESLERYRSFILGGFVTLAGLTSLIIALIRVIGV